jgi:PTH1 family peptidyl-tRNA hydrolase
VQSIIHSLGTNEFPRIKVGIGSSTGETIDYVLSRFSKKDRVIMDETEALAADAVEAILSDGVEAAMNKFNAVSVE